MTQLSPTSSQQPGAAFRRQWDEEVVLLRRQIESGHGDAPVHAKLAETLITLWCYGFERREAMLPGAEENVRKALELDANLGAAHSMRGVLDFCDWQWAKGETSLRRGVELAPESSAAHHWLALVLAALGRYDEALKVSENTMKYAESSAWLVGHGSILYFAHDFEEMAVVMEKVTADHPDYAPGYDWLGMAYVQLERFDESVAVYEKAVALSDGTAEIAAGLGHAYGLAGREKEARVILDEFLRVSEHCYIPPVQIAFVAFGLGEEEIAYRMLDRALKERSWELAFARAEPWLDHLREIDRFAKILEPLKFPELPKT